MFKWFNTFVERFKYFCITQKGSFYAGMVFAVFSLLALTVKLSLAVSAILCPFLTIGFYFIASFAENEPKEFRKSREFKNGLLAAILGCAWVLLFVVI